MLRRLALGVALSAFTLSAAIAQQGPTASTGALDRPAVVQVPAIGHAFPQSDGTAAQLQIYTLYEPTYQLLGVKNGAGASATGAPVGPVWGADYIFACSGTIAGATLQLQTLGPDGVTYQNVAGASFTALPGTVGVTIGSSLGSVTPNVRVTVTGANGTPSVYCNLSWVP